MAEAWLLRCDSTLRSQTIGAATDKVEIATISQKLQLLSNFWFDVSIVGIELTQPVLERVMSSI